jgi:hypothetical protein
MFVVDNESFVNFPFDCNVPRETVIDQVVVTGTHSAGKTTLLNDYGTQTELLESITGYKVPAGFAAAYERVDDVTVPIVVAPEAATYYAQKIAKNSRVVTDQYTIDDQIGMESTAKRLITRANIVAAHLSHVLQPDIARPLAIVASDRSPLDGHVYSAIRTPDAEQELIDMASVANATGGKTPLHYAGCAIPYRENARVDAVGSFSIAFVTDHTEISLESSQYRSDDIQFRNQIAQSMTAYYKSILGDERVVALSGDRSERLKTFSVHIRALAHYMIEAESQYA